MPDASQIPLETQVPSLQSALAPMSTLLNMRQGVNNLQLQQQAIDSGGMNLQAQAQANQERKNVIQVMQDPNSGIFKPDGTIDMQAAQKAIMPVAPQTGADVLDKLATTSNHQTMTRAAINNLTEQNADRLSGVIRGVQAAGGGIPEAIKGIGAAADMYGDPKMTQLASTLTNGLQDHPDLATNPQASGQMLDQLVKRLRNPTSAGTELAPSVQGLQTGAGVQPTNMNPQRSDMGTNAAPLIPNALGPSQRQGHVTIAGRDFWQVTDPDGSNPRLIPAEALPTAGASTAAAPAPAARPITAPSQSAGPQDQAAYLQKQIDSAIDPVTRASARALQQKIIASNTGAGATLPDWQGQQNVHTAAIEQVRQSANQLPPVQETIGRLYSIVNGDTKFGPGSEGFAKFTNAMQNLLPGSGGGADLTGWQSANAYLERLATQVSAAGGTNTVAGLQANQAATGTPVYTRDALLEKLHAIEAITTAQQGYRQGLDKYVGTPTVDALGKPEYDAKFTQANDLTAWRLMNDMKRGDAADAKKIYGPLSPDEQAALKAKAATLQSMTGM